MFQDDRANGGGVTLLTSARVVTNYRYVTPSQASMHAAVQRADGTLRVLGHDFVEGSVVVLDGEELATTFVDGHELLAEIPVGLKVGVKQVRVWSPGGGGYSLPGEVVVLSPGLARLRAMVLQLGAEGAR